MKNDLTKLFLAILALGVFLLIAFTVTSKKFYTANLDGAGNEVSVEGTTWELVQYSDGPRVENLVGTDWVIHFGNNDGFIRLCDTHPFSYALVGDRASFTFSDIPQSSCQESTVSSEAVFFDLLKASPQIERLSYKTEEFKEVLTLVSGNKKMVFIPRVDVPASSTGALSVLNSKEKSVSLRATLSCEAQAGGEEICLTPAYQGEFSFTGLDVVPGKQAYTISTMTDPTGISTVMLPLGTYQVSLPKSSVTVAGKAYSMKPVIFSIVATTADPYELLLTLDPAV